MPASAGPVPQATSALHAHSSRWAPAAQAIFTTQASRPWIIQAANDLACLVFGLTKADIGKLGILEVVREERRAWLEDRLTSPGSDSPAKQRVPERANQRSVPKSAVSPAFGNGVTAQLLSKPAWRERRAQTAGARGGQKPAKNNDAGESHHVNNRSRGVLLCGDVVPVQKRNGATGAASLWVKEKRGGLIWVLEEIVEDVAYLDLDGSGNVVSESGATAAIWGFGKGVKGLNIGRLVPHVPRCLDVHTGSVDVTVVARLKQFAVCTVADAYVPATVEIVPRQRGLRISTIPHIAGMMVISASTLRITSSNTVFSAALFGRPQPDGLPITDLILDFDKVLRLLFEDNAYELVDGLVIPEHSFRRARALLAIRESWPDAATALLRPNGLPAKHRDGSEIKVDVQMRVVKGNMRKHDAAETVIEEVVEEEDDAQQPDAQRNGPSGVLYALWITYSRHIHGVGPQLSSASATASLMAKPETPLHQPSPGQTQRPDSPPDMTPEGPVCNGTPDDVQSSPTEPTPPSAVDLLRAVADASRPAATRTDAANGNAKTPPAPPAKPAKLAAAAVSSATAAVTAMKAKKKKTIDDFVILEDMGQGAYGQVKLARYKRDAARKMVLKYVTKRRILVDTWTRDRRLGTVPLEIHVLDYLRRDGLRHPNIVEMADFFEDDVNYYIEMVPHGLPGMDLFDYIELRVNMDEAECRSIFRQVANAVHHLHARALVVHRDIKDENVILDGEGNIKLIDFGSATYIKNGPFDVFVGTIGTS
jgi:protein-serine/threonine kinase